MRLPTSITVNEKEGEIKADTEPQRTLALIPWTSGVVTIDKARYAFRQVAHTSRV